MQCLPFLRTTEEAVSKELNLFSYQFREYGFHVALVATVGIIHPGGSACFAVSTILHTDTMFIDT